MTSKKTNYKNALYTILKKLGATLLSFFQTTPKESLPISEPLPPVQNTPEQPSTTSTHLLPYLWAKNEIGVKEIPGSSHSKRVLWYHSFTTLKASQDEVPWCSSFMCAAAESTGFWSTKSAAAISWLKFGTPGDGSPGDIAILKRVGGNHVAFIDKQYTKGDQFLTLLGGNQNNQVGVKLYSAKDLLAIRRFPSQINYKPAAIT